MRLLIDIGHPAHVHLFKYVAWRLLEKGHKILFTCRDREHIVYLLKTYGFVYENYGKHYKSMQGKIVGLVKNELQLLDTALRFKPDMFLSHGSTIAAHVSFLIRKPHIALEDTFNMEQVRLSLPFTDVVLTGNYDHPCLGKKEIKYPGYHELAYLHPNVFTPDERVLSSLGVAKGEKYAILRFVAWAATHDVGHSGISYSNKLLLVKTLSEKIRVFISSEKELPTELNKYQIRIRPEDMHSALAFAHLYVGESGTMASESMMLGTKALFFNVLNYAATASQEAYGIIHNFSAGPKDQLKAINLASSIADEPYSIKQEHIMKRNKMLGKLVDVSAFLVWFIEETYYLKRRVRQDDIDFSKFLHIQI